MKKITVPEKKAHSNRGLIILVDFFVYPSEQLFQVAEGDITHVGDSERFFFQLAVAVTEDCIVLFLNRFDSFGDINAATGVEFLRFILLPV